MEVKGPLLGHPCTTSQTVWERAYCAEPLNHIARAIITCRIEESQAAERCGGTEGGEKRKKQRSLARAQTAESASSSVSSKTYSQSTGVKRDKDKWALLF